MRSAPSLCGRWIGVRLSLSHFSGWRGFPSVSSASSSFSSDSAPDAEGGLRVGQVFEKEVTFTQEQVKAFAEITGDENPIHRQSQGRVGKQIIVPGLLCSSLFPAIIGTQFPGKQQPAVTNHKLERKERSRKDLTGSESERWL